MLSRNPVSSALLLAAVAVGLQACATPEPPVYGPISETAPHGYTDRPNGDGGYTVLSVVPAHSSVDVALGFWDRRAAELCPSGVAKRIIFRSARNEQMTPAGYVQAGAGISSRLTLGFEVEGYVYCNAEPPRR